MKAKFEKKQPSVTLKEIDGILYVYICLNEVEKQEEFTDGEGNIVTETYYEYDYTEFCEISGYLNTQDIIDHPEKYIDYAPEKSQTTYAKIEEMSEKIASIDKCNAVNYKAARISAQSFTDAQALEVPELYDEYEANGTYERGDRKRYNGVLYKCLNDHTAQTGWTPENAPSLWVKVLIPDPEQIPEWEQPESTNGYGKGDKVTHAGKTWESLVDGNVWEPGATGTEGVWKEVYDA